MQQVTIMNFAFQPQSVSVSAGTMVTWTNNDTAPHTSTSDTGAWNSGTLTTAGTYERVFSTAGTYPYHCAIHPSMLGTIIVTAK